LPLLLLLPEEGWRRRRRWRVSKQQTMGIGFAAAVFFFLFRWDKKMRDKQTNDKNSIDFLEERKTQNRSKLWMDT